MREPAGGGSRLRPVVICAAWVALAITGCTSDSWRPKDLFAKKVEPPPPAAGTMVMRAGATETVEAARKDPVFAEIDGAHNLRLQGEHAKAAAIFHQIAKNKKAPPEAIEESIYHEAECYYQLSNFRDAAPLYKVCLERRFSYGRYQDQAAERLYEIAMYWLKDTVNQIQAYQEKSEGKRWAVMPAGYFHFTKDKPFLDMEGHAMKMLEAVYLHDISGHTKEKLGEKALFQMGTVKRFHENYRDADFYYSQVYQKWPESPLAPKALKMSIICKQLMTGGSDHDTRSLQEAQKLIQTSKSYPELAENDFLARQWNQIGLQQADRDFNIAEFYRRTGHPGSAYFYYELVLRRYPGSKYAEKATGRKQEMQAKLDQQQPASTPSPVVPGAPQPLPPDFANQPIVPVGTTAPGQGNGWSPMPGGAPGASAPPYPPTPGPGGPAPLASVPAPTGEVPAMPSPGPTNIIPAPATLSAPQPILGSPAGPQPPPF
jgi:outer membrane protein assembly factor BamD (BamD/ComL family)